MCVCPPQTIAKLVQITPITIWDIVDITICSCCLPTNLQLGGPTLQDPKMEVLYHIKLYFEIFRGLYPLRPYMVGTSDLDS